MKAAVLIVVLAFLTFDALGENEINVSLIESAISETALDRALPLLTARCEGFAHIGPGNLHLPVSKSRTDFIACGIVDVSMNGRRANMVGLSYADGKLVLAEVLGKTLLKNIIDKKQIGDNRVRYAGLDIYPDIAWALNPERDHGWRLAPDHLHAHLFLLSNPAIEMISGKTDKTQSAGSGLEPLPDINAKYDDVLKTLNERCALVESKTISPPMLATGPKTQVQLNCFGWEIAGFPRKIEAVFGDEKLALIWILTGAEEHERILTLLKGMLGDPSGENQRYVYWENGAGLRKDKPEILIASPQLAAHYFRQADD